MDTDINVLIASLIKYGLDKNLFEPCDAMVVQNSILSILKLDSVEASETQDLSLEDILCKILDDAVKRGVCEADVTSRDLLDTALMGAMTPMPREVRKKFEELYFESPKKATDWYFEFSQNTDYIRTYRIKKDMRWKTSTEYGNLDITINLSKPEKDPKAIAAAKAAPQSGYPKCMLCVENEGYAGRINHPARQNHRIIPISLADESWNLQYSPYVYYNEHCIAFNSEHKPMVIDKNAFVKLLDFVTLFPHYFIGSNADLPIVGGSILSHEHFQGGCYSFPMEQSEVETKVDFSGYEDVSSGIVKWPMSVLRLRCGDKARLVDLADKILTAWRGYTDESAFVFAKTDGQPHNTITPIARRRGDDYELDLVLRNNITTAEHPLGVFHPHSELHHIEKENIGLIEVMGLAVLPARLKTELQMLKEAILSNSDFSGDSVLSKHWDWINGLKKKYTFNSENTEQILQEETGLVFAQVLEHAGVYKRTTDGNSAFLRFVEYVNTI